MISKDAAGAAEKGAAFGMDEKQMIPLTLEDGSVLLCEAVGVFSCGGKEYVALIPPDRGGAAEIFRYETHGETYDIRSIDDDREYDRAAAEYERLMDRPV